MTQTAEPGRVTATPAAREAITRLRAAEGGPVMFAQSGGCCAGSTPMCYPAGELIVGDADVLLGEIDGCLFYIDRRLDQAWHQDQFVLDVAAGEPEGFSLPAGDNLQFVTRTPACTPPAAPHRGRVAASSTSAGQGTAALPPAEDRRPMLRTEGHANPRCALRDCRAQRRPASSGGRRSGRRPG